MGFPYIWDGTKHPCFASCSAGMGFQSISTGEGGCQLRSSEKQKSRENETYQTFSGECLDRKRGVGKGGGVGLASTKGEKEVGMVWRSIRCSVSLGKSRPGWQGALGKEREIEASSVRRKDPDPAPQCAQVFARIGQGSAALARTPQWIWRCDILSRRFFWREIWVAYLHGHPVCPERSHAMAINLN